MWRPNDPMRSWSRKRRPLIERFWEKVDVRGPNECWPWLAATKQGGYGLSSDERGLKQLAHRIAYRLTKGSIPEGLVVCHHCDNPGCVNSAHLFLGTQGDNLQDMRRKGRDNPPRGARHPKARLTEDLCRRIRNDPRSHRRIARELGIGKSTVGMVKAGITWTHV
ncbi:MAG: HNH endonuclease signature motif containing protein [Caldilinea sp.]